MSFIDLENAFGRVARNDEVSNEVESNALFLVTTQG